VLTGTFHHCLSTFNGSGTSRFISVQGRTSIFARSRRIVLMSPQDGSATASPSRCRLPSAYDTCSAGLQMLAPALRAAQACTACKRSSKSLSVVLPKSSVKYQFSVIRNRKMTFCSAAGMARATRRTNRSSGRIWAVGDMCAM